MNLHPAWIARSLCLAVALMAERPASVAGEEPPASASPSTTEKRLDAKPGTPLKIGSVPCSRVLYLGNSITLHGPAPHIGWTGNWGMAASAKESDYVHLLTKRIASAAGGEPQTRVRNIADFERNYDKYDVATALKEELAFRPELVIVAIGENVPPLKDDEGRQGFRNAVQGLLRTLDENGDPTILVRSCFWADAAKDDVLEAAAKEANVTFVDIRRLGSDPKMSARSERKIEHAGVAGHPGDQGMKAIAESIWKGLESRAGIKPDSPAAKDLKD